MKLADVKDKRELRRQQAVIRTRSYLTFNSWMLPLTVIRRVNRDRQAATGATR